MAFHALAVVSLTVAQLPGCSTKSNNGADADGGDDATSADAATGTCAGDPPVMKWLDSSGNLQDPDWSCYDTDAAFAALPLLGDAGDDGSDTGPAVDSGDDGPTVEAGPPDSGTLEAATTQDQFQLTDFTTHIAVPGAQVDLFFGNTLANGVAPDVSATTGAGGDFSFPPPPGPVFGYRVAQRSSSPALQPVVQLDNVTPRPGTTFAGNSITTGSYQTLLAGVLGTTQTAPGSFVIVTGARDCAAHELLGGIVDLVDDATAQPIPTGIGPTDIHQEYFGPDNLPHLECTHTVPQPIALWAAINVPASRAVRIRLSGRMRPTDAQPVVIGERKVEAYPNYNFIERAYRLTPPQ
ncbi:MAG TPA: hypothetical protein VIF15_06655 [Polyangiaceae bacterium]|jgi:hypothetical protein